MNAKVDDGWRPSIGTMLNGKRGFVVLTTGGLMDVVEMMRRSGVRHDPQALSPVLMVEVARYPRWGHELRLSERQWSLLTQVCRATDGDTPLQRSGEATVGGLCARGSTIRSLVDRGLVTLEGTCAMIDGDGYTSADDVPWYAVSPAGRAALAAQGRWPTPP